MRPIELKIKGLRSYRDEQRIDFGDRTLVAVIGDTGAGKSSILEAITFALFGVSTWEKGNRDLISDYADVMKVDFTFSADGGRWRVTRARRRSGTPIDRLEGLDTGDRIDGSKPVTAKVEALLGLDYDTFLQTVILPQGKFDILLKSSDAERVKVLKRLFSVEALGRVRALAVERRKYADVRLSGLAQDRERYLDDPAKAAEAAAAEAEAAADAQRAIDRAKKDARALVGEAEAANKRVGALADALGAVEVDGLRTAEREAKQLAGVAQAGEARITRARLARDGARVARDRAREALATLAASGGDAASLAGVRSALGEVTKQAETLRANVAGMQASIADREAADDVLQEAATALSGAASALEQAADAHEAVANHSVTAEAALERYDIAADTLVAAQRALTDCDEATVATTDERREADADSVRAAAALEAASAALDEATAERDRLATEHALAHATADLAPGDPCPICTTVLASSFRPLRSPSRTAADRAVAAAMTSLRDAQEGEAEVKARIRVLTTRETKEAAAAKAAERHLGVALAELSSCSDVDVASGTVSDAALARARKPLAKAADDADKTVVRLARDLAKAEEAWRKADKRAGEAEVRAVAEDEAATTAVQSVDAQLESLRAALATLPPKLRPKLSRLNAKVERLQAGDISVDDADALAGLRAQEEALRSAGLAAEASQDELDDAEQAVEEAEADYEQKVLDPGRTLSRTLRTLAPPVSRLAALVGLPTPLSESSDDTPAAVAEWATALRVAATKAIPVAEKEQAKAAREMETQRAALTKLLAAAGADDLDELEVLRGEAVARAKEADTELKAAKAEITYVKELDRRLKAGEAFRDALKLLEASLTDGNFIGDLLHRRQKALLGVATVRLGEMSGGRYGFNEHFEIVDRDTGRPRSTRTLSGGESFQASLAFALAMVELAGRGGSRVDALFLDEGFGSLDASNLSDALDLLEQRAETGRLITIISHVREVADRIDDVLVVTDGASGSEIHWLTRAERDRLASADVEQALSGLLG